MQVAVAVCPLALWKEKYLCNALQAQCCKLTQHRKSSMHIVALTGRSVNYVKKCVTLFKLFFFFSIREHNVILSNKHNCKTAFSNYKTALSM